MRTILFVETGSGYGGSAICLDSLLRWLDQSRYRPVVAFYGEGFGIERIRRQGIKTVRLQRGLAWQQLLGLIHREQVDLIHSNNELYSHLATILAAAWMHRPCLVHMRGIRPLTQREHLLIHFVRHFLIISHAGMESYRADGIPKTRSSVIYDGIDVSAFDGPSNRAKARELLGVRENEIVIGIVSRLVPNKGHRDLLQALARLCTEIPQLRCLIVGGDPLPGEVYLSELKETAMELKVEQQVSFLGWRDDIEVITAGFDIAVQASRYIEGFGTAILEAMALSKPVIATGVGGIPELVEEGKTGLLVPPANSVALSEALRRLIKDETIRVKFGEAGRKRVEQYFDQRRLLKQLEALYEKLLSS